MIRIPQQYYNSYIFGLQCLEKEVKPLEDIMKKINFHNIVIDFDIEMNAFDEQKETLCFNDYEVINKKYRTISFLYFNQ